jgi:hypothetical protein
MRYLLLCLVVGCSPMLAPVTDAAVGDAAIAPDAFVCDCDDAIACTVDTCGVAGECVYTTDDTLCTGTDHCDTDMGCNSLERCDGDSDCDDGDDCTIDTCDVGAVCGHITTC